MLRNVITNSRLSVCLFLKSIRTPDRIRIRVWNLQNHRAYKLLFFFSLECGRTLLGNSGWFSSPGWGADTSPATQERCEWRIVATHGERVVLNITGNLHCRTILTIGRLSRRSVKHLMEVKNYLLRAEESMRVGRINNFT
ncbi:unnamed protein product [Diatraea saccharalis]|uniref:CUB domain-containing protein n=1 Tax=Diatraea saccharalis TaxID=40085 RepID=A0A9N9RF15_9NEOP|nr:unnamed protein product [Diatraea saccharalis]